MNEQNLIPYDQRSETEARENGRKGGIASGEARRRKKTAREYLQKAFETEVRIDLNDGNGEAKHTMKEVALANLALAASKGDLKSLQYALELIGEAPVTPAELIAIEYRELELLIDRLPDEAADRIAERVIAMQQASINNKKEAENE